MTQVRLKRLPPKMVEPQRKLKRLSPKAIQPNPPKLQALSLFSGIGGLDIAAHAAGIETVAFCEIASFAVRILNKRFPGIPVFDDVRKITRGAIEELLSGKDYANVVELYNQGLSVEEIAIMHNTPTGFMRGVLKRRGFDIKGEEEMLPGKNCVPIIDVIHGGFPCQDLSVAGKQAGLTGERSGLWYEMLRLVEELQPYYVVAENVRGACNLALPTVQAGLERTNYQVQSCVLPASAFGAPHRRERLFVLGIRKDVADSASERLQRLWTAREQESEVHAGKIVPMRDSIGSGELRPTPCVHGNYNRRGLSETSGDGLATTVRMWATPSSADCKGSHGGGQGRSLRTDIHDLTRMWPTPRANKPEGYSSDNFRPTLAQCATGEKRPTHGQLSPLWVEILMGYPIGWTDPDCDEPEPWPGWPAMMGERLWMTPKAGACGMTAKTKGRQLEMSTHLSAQTFVAERDFADQYPYEPPRTCTGIPNRAARLKCLGNAVVPAQAFPIFNTIEILETLLIKN